MSVAPWQERFPTSAEEAELQLANLVNEARAERGLPPLSASTQASAVARSHSRDMRNNHFFGHLSPTTGFVGDRLRKAGLGFAWAAENVGGGTSVQEIHDGFMESSAHRSGVLAAEAERLGVGVMLGENASGIRSAFATEVFVADSAPASTSPAAGAAGAVRLVHDERSVAGCRILGMHTVLLHRVDEATSRAAEGALRTAATTLRGNTVLAQRKRSRHGDRVVGTVYRCP